MTARPRAFAVAVALLVLAVAVVHGARLVEPLGVDQGVLACFTRWGSRGWLPYRDLFDGRPPLLLYWWSAARVVPGEIVRAVWWWEGLWLGGSLAVAYGLARRVWGAWEGLAAAALLFAGLWSPTWGGFGARALADELVALPMLGSAWLAWRALDRASLALPAGLLVGACGLFSIPSMALALAWPVVWLACGPVARRAGWMLAGVLVAWGLAFAWFAAHGATGRFVECVLVYPRYGVAFVGHTWGAVLSDFVGKVATGAGFLVVPAVLGVLRLARKRAREAHWAGAWVLATLAVVLLQRPLVGPVYELAVPGLAVVGAYGLVDVARAGAAKGARPIALIGVVALAILGALEVSAWCRAYMPDLELAVGRVSRDEYLATIDPGHDAVASEEQAARWLQEGSAPGDGVLVWGAPSVYALADRRPVTRYALHKLVLTDAPMSRVWPGLDVRREGFLEELRRTPPAIVLVEQDDRSALEPTDSAATVTRFRDLRALLQQEYERGPTVGRFVVYQALQGRSSTGTPNR